MDADNTINFFFGAGVPNAEEAAEASSQLRFDSDVSFQGEGEEDDMDVEDDNDEDDIFSRQGDVYSEDDRSRIGTSQEPPPLDANEHERFARTLLDFVSQPIEPETALQRLEAANQAHLQVLLTLCHLSKLDYDPKQEEWFRRERNTWVLLELMRNIRRTPREFPPNRHTLTDREILDIHLSRSPAAQVLHLLVRWCHLAHADLSPRREIIAHNASITQSLESVNDVFENDQLATAIWNLVHAGALYYVGETEESRVQTDILHLLLTKDPKHSWRMVSMSGGKAYSVQDNQRYGNPHRAIWKLACRKLASNPKAGTVEKACYGVISGDSAPFQQRTDAADLSINREDRVWIELRCLAERWSDEVLRDFHRECKNVTLGRTRGEADETSEMELFEGRYHRNRISTDETVLLKAIVECFKSASGLSATSGTRESSVLEKEDALFFARIQCAMIEGVSLDSVIKSELAKCKDSNSAKTGSKLRFLANLVLYASFLKDSLSNESPSPSAILSLKDISSSMRDSALMAYIEFLGRTSPQLLVCAPIYLSFLPTEADKIKWTKEMFRKATRPWNDRMRHSFLKEIERYVLPMNDALSEILLRLPESELEDEYFEIEESIECERRRKQFLPSSMADTDDWIRIWGRIELFRWSILANKPEVILKGGNGLVRRTTEAYLTMADPTRRTLAWKMGEIVLDSMAESLAVAQGPNQMMSEWELAEFLAWRACYQAWKNLATLDAQLDLMRTKLESYEEQIQVYGDRDPTKKRKLVRDRDADIRTWTDDVDEGDEVEPCENICLLASRLKHAFELALSTPLPRPPQAGTSGGGGELESRLHLRDRFVDSLIRECFRCLGASAKTGSELRLLAACSEWTVPSSSSGHFTGGIWYMITTLVNPLTYEVIRRLESDKRDLSVTREQVQYALNIVAQAKRTLLV